jgi:antitoxin (DNA-binding transcriptional repressor) of toxin-antitoxin stability system
LVGDVTVRDPRNHGGEVLERVARGETVVVTTNGSMASRDDFLAVGAQRRQPARWAITALFTKLLDTDEGNDNDTDTTQQGPA